VAKSTRIEELPDIFAQTDVLKALAERLAHLGNEVRSGIHRAAGIDDPVTADILTGLCATLDKQLWIVEAWSHPGR
jgi:DNA-binding ferritin-like protein